MSKIAISFNSKATEFFNSAGATKMRFDATWKKAQGLRLLPTTRKVSNHLLVETNLKGKSLVVMLDEAALEKLSNEGLPPSYLKTGEKFSLIKDKYKWIVLHPGLDHPSSVGIGTIK